MKSLAACGRIKINTSSSDQKHFAVSISPILWQKESQSTRDHSSLLLGRRQQQPHVLITNVTRVCVSATFRHCFVFLPPLVYFLWTFISIPFQLIDSSSSRRKALHTFMFFFKWKFSITLPYGERPPPPSFDWLWHHVTNCSLLVNIDLKQTELYIYIYIYTGKVSFSWGGGCLCIHSVNAHTYTKGRQIRRKHLGPSLCVYTHEMYLNLYVAQGQYVERPPVAACLTHSQMNWILPIRKVKTRENGTHAHRWKTKVLADTSIKLWPNAYDISPPHKLKLGRKMDNRMVNTTGQKRTIRPLHYYQCRVLLVPIEFALKIERDGETAGISSKSWAPESVRRPFNQRLTIPASAGTPRPATTKAQQERRRSVLYFIFSLFLISPFPLAASSGHARMDKALQELNALVTWRSHNDDDWNKRTRAHPIRRRFSKNHTTFESEQFLKVNLLPLRNCPLPRADSFGEDSPRSEKTQ